MKALIAAAVMALSFGAHAQDHHMYSIAEAQRDLNSTNLVVAQGAVGYIVGIVHTEFISDSNSPSE